MHACPICGGTMKLCVDGFEYCDTCEYNTRDDCSTGEDDT